MKIEALDWLKQLDEEYKITNESYTLENFIQELKDKGYISSDKTPHGKEILKLLPKTSNQFRKHVKIKYLATRYCGRGQS